MNHDFSPLKAFVSFVHIFKNSVQHKYRRQDRDCGRRHNSAWHNHYLRLAWFVFNRRVCFFFCFILILMLFYFCKGFSFYSVYPSFVLHPIPWGPDMRGSTVPRRGMRYRRFEVDWFMKTVYKQFNYKICRLQHLKKFSFTLLSIAFDIDMITVMPIFKQTCSNTGIILCCCNLCLPLWVAYI